MIFNEEFAKLSKNFYDLRSKDLTIENAVLLGKSFGTELIKQNKKTLCIGHDRRILSKSLANSFIEGALTTGINVIFLGEYGTSAIQYMSKIKDYDSAVSVTASHNSIEYHGFKFFIENHAFCGNFMEKLILRIIHQDFILGNGSLLHENCAEYIDFLQNMPIQGKFKIAWDLLNGSGGDIFPSLNLKGSHQVLNAEKKDSFGGFAPDPDCQERIKNILELSKKSEIDFGFLIDGDADRCVLISEGKIIPGDVLLAIITYLEHQTTKNEVKVVWDDISSVEIKKWASKFSQIFISKTGHSHIQNLSIKEKTFLGGEISGHYMFKDIHYIDDGIYTALRLIGYLETLNLTVQEVTKFIPTVIKKKFPNFICQNFQEQQETMFKIKSYLTSFSMPYSEFDGFKVIFKEGTLSIRASNTESLIRISAEILNINELNPIESFVANIKEYIQK